MTRPILVFIGLLLTGFLLTDFTAAQQTTKIPRIGYVTVADDLSSPSSNLQAFRHRMSA